MELCQGQGLVITSLEITITENTLSYDISMKPSKTTIMIMMLMLMLTDLSVGLIKLTTSFL